MDKLVAAIEKQQGKFEKISTNNYMMAIKMDSLLLCL